MLRSNIHLINKLFTNNNISTLFVKLNHINTIRKCSTSIKASKEIAKISTSDINTFGTLSKQLEKHDEILDEGDKEEENLLENIIPNAKKLRTTQYANMIKTLIRKRQIQEAIDILEERMIKQDRTKPENYIYNLLLGACGKLGYTKKAFQLFNQMKKRGLEPTGGTYTALFNACSNSPWLEDGLTRAKKLKELMFEKGVISNGTTYNAMIKAFGRCGDTQTAFSIVDEMIQNRIPIRTDTINFLLHTCISNQEAGFLQALLVWRKFQQNYITPDIYSFNLMLHCIRDCQLGDPGVAKNLLENLEQFSPKLKWNRRRQIIGSENVKLMEKKLDNVELYNHIPNLLAEKPALGNMVEINEIKTAEQRLLLVGGLSGYLKTMENHKITPNIKTFTLLLDNLPSTLAAENILLKSIKNSKVKLDIDFLNMLIKKRSMRFDYQNAKEVLNLFEKYHLRPDIFTYGILALCCETLEEARMLLQEMSDNGYRINIEILGSLIKSACIKENFVYVLEIMELVKKEKIKTNKQFLGHLEKLHKRVAAQRKEGKQRGSFWTNGSKIFLKRYKLWLQEIEPDKIEDTHPWEQFRKPVETNVKNYKDPQVHFKPRITSKYRQKTGTLRRNNN